MTKQGSNGIRAIGKRELLQGEIAPMLQVPVSSSIEPKSLAELLALSPEQLAAVDIARANLLCAEGLPGAEGLNVEVNLRILNSWTKHAELTLERNYYRFKDNPAEFRNSEPYWLMVTLTTFFQLEKGIKYKKELAENDDAWDWADSRDIFIHGLIGPTRSGTCPSLPVFFTAIGRRLGYPLRLVNAPAHVFFRWDSDNHPNPAWREKFNIECHGKGMGVYPDEHYHHWPLEWTPELFEVEKQRGEKRFFLRSLEPTEEIAEALCQRGHCLEAARRFEEARNAYREAFRLAPHNDRGGYFAAGTLVKQRITTLETCNYYLNSTKVDGDSSIVTITDAMPSEFLEPRANTACLFVGGGIKTIVKGKKYE